ncbi:hypothetical protein SAMN04244553_4982 [Nocardia amikacinitolerans]|uniref:Uncharacterized protein n=1 Tax=Nocardia amikacinitolerans TaxID=756689 RepID=A0A285LSX2_9NOCA|nr:hypothetical protein SAMN04244553_4982 [Nocardia amikacinitolerans]
MDVQGKGFEPVRGYTARQAAHGWSARLATDRMDAQTSDSSERAGTALAAARSEGDGALGAGARAGADLGAGVDDAIEAGATALRRSG